MLYANVMSRIEGHPDQGLLQEKGGRGFPYLVFLDETGAVVHPQPGGWREVEGFEQSLWALDAVASSDAADAAMAKLVLGKANLADTRAALGPLTLTEAQRKRWAVIEPPLEWAEIMGKLQDKSLSPADVGAQFVTWIGTPKEPTEGRQHLTFWHLIQAHAEAKRDVALYERTVGVLKDAYVKMGAGDERLKQFTARWEKTLADLKAGAGDG